MTSSTKTFTPDQVTAEAFLDLVDRRAEELAERVKGAEPDEREHVTTLLQTVTVRSNQLRGSLPTADTQHTIRVASSLLRIIESLDADLELANNGREESDLDGFERQLRSWLGAVDELRVQGSLGKMEARDGYNELVDRGHQTWHRIVQGLHTASDDAGKITEDVGLVLRDLRDTVNDVVRSAR